jgi:hypothetical protein
VGPLFLQADAVPPELPGGYGMALVQTLFALLGVCILAWVVLRALAQRGFGVRASSGRIQVLERVHLDAKRTLWLVKVGEKVLLVGAGDGGAPVVLGHVEDADREP